MKSFDNAGLIAEASEVSKHLHLNLLLHAVTAVTANEPQSDCRCLTQMGTDKENFVELTERIGRKTGGVGVSPFTSDIRGQADPAAYLIIRGKAVADKVSDLTDLFTDILHNAKLDDQARFKQVTPPSNAESKQLALHRAQQTRCDVAFRKVEMSWSKMVHTVNELHQML